MGTARRRIARAVPTSQHAFVAFAIEDTAVAKFIVPASDTERDTGGIFLEDAQELDQRWAGELFANLDTQSAAASQQDPTSPLTQLVGATRQESTSPLTQLDCASQQDSTSQLWPGGDLTPVVAECQSKCRCKRCNASLEETVPAGTLDLDLHQLSWGITIRNRHQASSDKRG